MYTDILLYMRTIDEETSGASSRIVRTKVNSFARVKLNQKFAQGQVNKHENVRN